MADDDETLNTPEAPRVAQGPTPIKPPQIAHIELPAGHKLVDPHTTYRQVAKINFPAGHDSVDPRHRPVTRIDKPAEK